MEQDYKGVWGNPTSNIDWCESNYQVSYYIAEFWNTLSNIFIIVFSVIGLGYARRDNLELRFILCYVILLIVGIGSALFHGTLLYQTQLLDELPMIYATACLVYITKEIAGEKDSYNKQLIAILGTICTVVTVTYVAMNIPIIFQASFVVLAIIALCYSVLIVMNYKHSRLLFMTGIGLFLTGAVIWITDRVLCDQLQSLRVILGYPLKPLSQGHAWWHFFSMSGSYLFLLFSIHARNCHLDKDCELVCHMGVIPVVMQKKTPLLPSYKS